MAAGHVSGNVPFSDGNEVKAENVPLVANTCKHNIGKQQDSRSNLLIGQITYQQLSAPAVIFYFSC